MSAGSMRRGAARVARTMANRIARAAARCREAWAAHDAAKARGEDTAELFKECDAAMEALSALGYRWVRHGWADHGWAEEDK